MRITYFGHSAFEIETAGTRILVDPFISGNKHCEGVVRADDLEPDVIILTHAHGDHFGDTPSILKRTDALLISNFEITEYLRREHGHENSFGMNTGGGYDFEWGRVEVTRADHSSSFPDGTYGGNPNGFVLLAEDKCIYNTGDTSAFSEMAWIGEDFSVDLMLMPIGDCFTMGPRGALRAARLVKPTLSVPLHYNTFPPIEVDVDLWSRLMKEVGLDTVIPGPGESLEL
jgi:L-ascorbate metabolism protein UlaG (beta-lactamase superfamily)